MEIILKGLLQRLNTIPYNEPSYFIKQCPKNLKNNIYFKGEELRLKILQLITKIVTELPEGFIPLISEYSFMLVKILSDSSPDSKKVNIIFFFVGEKKILKGSCPFNSGFLRETKKNYWISLEPNFKSFGCKLKSSALEGEESYFGGNVSMKN